MNLRQLTIHFIFLNSRKIGNFGICFSLLLMVVFASIYNTSGQDTVIFNRQRLMMKAENGNGIVSMIKSDVELMSGIEGTVKSVKSLAEGIEIVVLDYYKGNWGIVAGEDFGFVPEAFVAVNQTLIAKKDEWEQEVSDMVYEEEVRQRRIQREKQWNQEFLENSYAVEKEDIDRSGINPFIRLQAARVVVYNFNLETDQEQSIIKNGKLNPSAISPGIELEKQQSHHITKYIADSNSYGRPLPAMFNPKVGVLFYDKKDSLLGYIDIDLDNNWLKSSIYIPATKHHNYYVNQYGEKFLVKAGLDFENYELVWRPGFSKMGRRGLINFFRTLGLKYATYPQKPNCGLEVSYSHSGYFVEGLKITPAFTVKFKKNSLSLGPKIWIGKYYGKNGETSSGAQFTYIRFFQPYYSRLKYLLFYDLDYGYDKKVREEFGPNNQLYSSQIDEEQYFNNAIGVGVDILVFKQLYFRQYVGIGKGLSKGEYKYVDERNQQNNFDLKVKFSDGADLAEISWLIKSGLYWHLGN